MGRRYSRLKPFAYPKRLKGLPKHTGEISAPITIRIKPTNVCNQNCGYCSYRSGTMDLGKDMVLSDQIPKEKMFEIIDDAQTMGVKSIVFSGGGEPFCYPFFEETIERLSKTDIQFAALTNGTRLQGRIAELFAAHGTWIRISIDGYDNESYAAYRGVSQNAFTKVMNNIEQFSKHTTSCYLGCAIVVDETNCDHIFDLTMLLKNAGVDSVKIAPVILSGNGAENNVYHGRIETRVKEQIERILNELKSDDFEIFDSYHRQLETFDKTYTWCPYIQLCPVIGANSVLYSCHDKAYDDDTGRIGDLRNRRLKEVWFESKSRFFEINPSQDCRHHCVVDNANQMILEFLDIDDDHKIFL